MTYAKVFIFSLVIMSVAELTNAQSNWRSPMLGYPSRPIVIIKADDYFTTNWQTFFEIVESTNISASIGVITGWTNSNAMDEVKEKHTEYYTNDLGEYVNRYEFWNHGYDHDNDQFGVRSKTEQLDRLQTSQNIFITGMGFESHAFGAPGNGINQDTKYAIDDYNTTNNDQLKIWMNYKSPNFSSVADKTGWNYLESFQYGTDYSHALYGITYADASTDLQLSSSAFISSYSSFQTPIILIELHPAGYNSASVASLTTIINFLKSKNALFVTPSYLYGKANTERYCGDYYNAATINAVNSLSAGSSVSDICDHTIVHSGANITFTATKTIYLMPGFTSLYGSTFKASISSSTSADLAGGRVASTSDVPDEAALSNRKITVYPNPTEEKFFIDFGDEPFDNSSVLIHNSSGKVIRQIAIMSNKQAIDLSGEPNGLYLIQVLPYDNSVHTFKILKK